MINKEPVNIWWNITALTLFPNKSIIKTVITAANTLFIKPEYDKKELLLINNTKNPWNTYIGYVTPPSLDKTGILVLGTTKKKKISKEMQVLSSLFCSKNHIHSDRRDRIHTVHRL